MPELKTNDNASIAPDISIAILLTPYRFLILGLPCAVYYNSTAAAMYLICRTLSIGI